MKKLNSKLLHFLNVSAWFMENFIWDTNAIVTREFDI